MIKVMRAGATRKHATGRKTADARMKKSTSLPIVLGLIILALLGVIAVLSLPVIKVLMSAQVRHATTNPPPAPPEKAGEATPAPPRAPEPGPIPKPKPKPKPDPKPDPKLESPPKPVPPRTPEPVTPAPEPGKDPAPADAELEAQIAALYPLPNIQPLEMIVDNWKNVPRRAFPKSVTINESLEFQLLHEERVIGGRTVPAGAHVVPLELRENSLVVAPDIGTTMRAEVPVDETNFKQLIHARYMEFVQRQTHLVMERRAGELARLRNAKAHETALADYNDGSDPRFDAMKESLRRAEAAAFDLENATQWRWLGKETVDGVEYDAGLAVFETESAFGVSRAEIKALMREGKVEKWVDPASGDAI